MDRGSASCVSGYGGSGMSRSSLRTWEIHELGEIHHQGSVGQPKGAWVVFGGQAGSEGKGAIAGWLAKRYEWGASICTFMPNAGHTWVRGRDEVVVSQLPIALVSSTVERLLIGPASVIAVSRLIAEIEKYDGQYNVSERLGIHPRAMMLMDQDPEWEREHLAYIASTAKGSGAALARKVRREEGVVLARDVDALAPYIMDTTKVVNEMVNMGKGVLVEQAQGFDLDINHGVSYPYCTSRGTTPMQIMADVGLSGRLVSKSIAVVRTKPIRVGNADGYSGDYGSEETTWGDVSRGAGRDVEEITTVTKRVRRVFEMDWDRIAVMSQICRPTEIALTFADYVDPSVFQCTHEKYMQDTMGNLQQWSLPVARFVRELEEAIRRPTMNPKVKLIKTGPDDAHTIRLLDV